MFVVGAPRSGVRLVYESLSHAPGVFSRDDGHGDPLTLPGLSTETRDWQSDRLVDAGPEVVEWCREAFEEHLRDRDDYVPEGDAGTVRTLECSLPNALRVPFLRTLFPRARFVVVERDPTSVVSSLMEAWESGRFVTYASLPGWRGLSWSFPLIEGWRDLIDAELSAIATRQWSSIADQLNADVMELPPTAVVRVDHDTFLHDPMAGARQIAERLGWEMDRLLPSPLPLTRTTISTPAREKWRVAHPGLTGLFGVDEDGSHSRGSIHGDSLGGALAVSVAGSGPDPTGGPPAGDSLFKSSYSRSVLALLSNSGLSLLVSTYQSGRLISLREEHGKLNTHLVLFDSPMGVAASPASLVVATRTAIIEHCNHVGAARALTPEGSHDACYLPRNIHVTGEMGVHEIVLAEDGLWAVSTRFSCLATLDGLNSFVPRWKPGFITKLAAEDRCHLNGVALRNGRVRYVSALGRTDTSGGWREGKGTAGLVIDVSDGKVIADGLAMPHSPRYYDGHIWVLESGNGTLGRIDPETGTIDTVATLPGFTRGLAFTDRIAWVGLSQVRETVFRGLPVTSQADRACGVWAVDIDTGETLGWVRFEGIVQEIFDVQLCPWHHPGIAELGDEMVGESFTLP